MTASALVYPLLAWAALASLGATQARARDGKAAINWALVASIETEEGRRFASIERDTTLKTGDQLKMVVELREICYVYVLYRSPGGAMSRLLPPELPQDAFQAEGGKHYFPPGRSWLTLDDTKGRETIYLLASLTRLDELEELLISLEKATPDEKAALSEQVVAHVRDLRKKHLLLAAKAERPPEIAGDRRDFEEDLSVGHIDVVEFAKPIVVDPFFARTFTLEHE